VYDRSVRWSYADAALGYHNPYSHPIRASVDLVLSGAGPREIEISLNGRGLHAGPFDDAPKAVPRLDLVLQPGYNRLDFRSPQAPAYPEGVRAEPKVAIGLREVALTIDPASLLEGGG
jgi:hypothetical protein